MFCFCNMWQLFADYYESDEEIMDAYLVCNFIRNINEYSTTLIMHSPGLWYLMHNCVHVHGYLLPNPICAHNLLNSIVVRLMTVLGHVCLRFTRRINFDLPPLFCRMQFLPERIHNKKEKETKFYPPYHSYCNARID